MLEPEEKIPLEVEPLVELPEVEVGLGWSEERKPCLVLRYGS